MASVSERLAKAWNAFRNEETSREQEPYNYPTYGAAYSVRPDRVRFTGGNERSIITSIYTRLAIDVSSVPIRHVRLDGNGRYLETINSGLNDCLTLEANIDQTASFFKQDLVQTMFDKGAVAIVPIETTLDPNVTNGYDVKSFRVGEIVQWYPRHVRVKVYDDRPDVGGIKRELVLAKSSVAIIENPFYSVMNEPNSTLQRLVRKLSLLDSVDEASSSGRLDILIQLPYQTRSEARRTQAEQRRKDLEFQLRGSTYGVGYIDASEKVTQLNRPAENQLLKQIETLTEQLYNQLGLTEEIVKGTADESVMLNYYNRTVEPILRSIAESMRTTFLSKTARTQLQSIEYYRDPFQLVPVSAIAEIADKFTRNEVLSSNEVRGLIGFKPVKDPAADELRNKNLPIQEEPTGTPPDPNPMSPPAEPNGREGRS